MSIFRRKTIFHVEDTLPDPEEIKLRFRRRVLLLTFVGFLAVLSIPVARDLREDLLARNQARKFAEKILETRRMASIQRFPISLELADDGRSWRRIDHPGQSECGTAGPHASENWDTHISWKLKLQQASGETLSGRNLCLHPALGLLLDHQAVGDGKLLITAFFEAEDKQLKESAYLLLRDFGSDLQMGSHWD